MARASTPASSRFAARPDRIALGLVGALLLVVLAVAWIGEATPGWKRDQDNVRRIVSVRMGEKAAALVPTGLRQNWIPELGRVDRCVTCHATIDWGSELATAPNPARSHPMPELLAKHPIERFGCTLCHGGQGTAVEKDAAHGDVAFWDEPLLDDPKARRYGTTAAGLMESNCNACHRLDAQVAGMPLVNEAKAYVQKRKCSKCHTINGEGGVEGPDLTREGDKHPTHMVFPEGWAKPRTALAWHLAHLADPPAVTPGSTMPKFVMDERQRLGIALLVLSWKTNRFPSAWIPRPVPATPPR